MPTTSENRASIVLSAVEEATPMLRRFARNFALDIEDLQQESALVTLECLDKALTMERYKPYIHRAIRNRIFTVFIRKPSVHVLSLDMPRVTGSDSPDCTLADILVAPSTPRDDAKQDATTSAVHAAMHRLPTSEQVIMAEMFSLGSFIPCQGVPLNVRASATRTRSDSKVAGIRKLSRDRGLLAMVGSVK